MAGHVCIGEPVFSKLERSSVKLNILYGGYYTLVRRYEFYVRVARTISHQLVQCTSKILFLPLEHKIHIFKLTCNVLFTI